MAAAMRSALPPQQSRMVRLPDGRVVPIESIPVGALPPPTSVQDYVGNAATVPEPLAVPEPEAGALPEPGQGKTYDGSMLDFYKPPEKEVLKADDGGGDDIVGALAGLAKGISGLKGVKSEGALDPVKDVDATQGAGWHGEEKNDYSDGTEEFTGALDRIKDDAAAPDTAPAQVAAAGKQSGTLPEKPAAAPEEKQGYFDKLLASEGRMALLTGSLGMMAEASRPGASVGGSLAKGALSGLGYVGNKRKSEQERADAKAEADAKKQANSVRPMTAEEKVQWGLPDGVSAVMKGDGTPSILNRPEAASDGIPKTRTYNVGNEEVTEEWDPVSKSMKVIARAPRYKPSGPEGPPSMSEIVSPLLAKVARGEKLTSDEQAAWDMYKAADPMSVIMRNMLGGGTGGPAPSAAELLDGTTPPAAPPATSAPYSATPLRNPADRAAAVAPVPPLKTPAAPPPPKQSSGSGNALTDARKAIAAGADRATVIQRLQKMGIDPKGL